MLLSLPNYDMNNIRKQNSYSFCREPKGIARLAVIQKNVLAAGT